MYSAKILIKYVLISIVFYRLKTLGHVCLHIEAVKKRNSKKPEVLPEYNCLVLSPANLWQRSIELYSQDTNLINTIFSYQVKPLKRYCVVYHVKRTYYLSVYYFE